MKVHRARTIANNSRPMMLSSPRTSKASTISGAGCTSVYVHRPASSSTAAARGGLPRASQKQWTTSRQ
eukprot:8955867-Alexandrium_andersonii.AAC.1